MKEVAHLKKLSVVKSNAGVKFLTPAAFPGNHCPMHTSLSLSSNIKGMSTLVVGTAECGIYSRRVVEKSAYKDSGLHWTYILDSNEVVFGCRQGVIETIRQMDEEGAKAIMLILTCVPEVIGEDIEGIVYEIQPEVKAKLCFVTMGHFKCNSHPSGFWKTLEALGALMTPTHQSPKTINVLGRSPEEKHIPMPSILVQLIKQGFTLRMLGPKSSMEDFLAASDATVNLVVSPYMNPLAERMKKELDIPLFSLHDCYSVSDIDHILQQLAEYLDIDWGDAFAVEREKLQQGEAQAKQILNQVVYTNTPRSFLPPLPLAFYLEQFGMTACLLHIEEFYPDDRRWAKKLIEKNMNPLLCHMVNDKEDTKLIEKLSPDLCFGEMKDSSGEVAELSHLYELYGQLGYERSADLLTRILQARLKSLDRKEAQNGNVSL
ncbi:nitrogenase component 1 [Scatolibacter rhodanostii]|uniref:nitrogenase component 1 n=1 Tax=Scatolibacter rhodanostii TaxID=2014781 RepID=UPI000C07213E|nr:nitrogenase component 1 [Scatolibacter rhodanostii]